MAGWRDANCRQGHVPGGPEDVGGYLPVSRETCFYPGHDPELWNRFKASIRLPAGASWDRDHIRRRLTKFCTSKGIDLVDPADVLRQAAQKNRYLYFPWNRHWTPAGHELVADLLLKELPMTPP